MCANDGYFPNMTNFSCRVAKCARGRIKPSNEGDNHHSDDEESQNPAVNIIEALIEYAGRVPGLREAMGENFARGHKEVSLLFLFLVLALPLTTLHTRRRVVGSCVPSNSSNSGV